MFEHLFKAGNGNNQWQKNYGKGGIYGQVIGLQNRGGSYSAKVADQIQLGMDGTTSKWNKRTSEDAHFAEARLKTKASHDAAVVHSRKVLYAAGFTRDQDKTYPSGGGVRENWSNKKNGATATIDHDAPGDYSPSYAVSVEVLHNKRRVSKDEVLNEYYATPDGYSWVFPSK